MLAGDVVQVALERVPAAACKVVVVHGANLAQTAGGDKRVEFICIPVSMQDTCGAVCS